MNRRGFLTAMLAAGAAPAIVQAANLMPIFMRRESGLLAPQFMDDLVRGMYAYNIGWDDYVVRFDILAGAHQFAVDQRFNRLDDARQFGAKKIAIELFDKSLRHEGLSWADVRPLPLHNIPGVNPL